MTALATAPEGAPEGAGRPAHRDPNVLRWLLAYGLSVFGDSVYFLALGWSAQEVAGPAQVGLVMAVGAVPRAVLMLGGGVVADRYGPRRVVILSDAVRAALVLLVAGALFLGDPGLWLLVAVALLFGVVDAVFMPAVGALPPRLTTPDQLARLQGLRLLMLRGGHTLGPPTAGMAMAFGGAGSAFLIAGGVFTLSLLLLLTLRIGPLPAPAAPAAGEETADEEAAVRSAPGAAGAKGAPRSGAWTELADGLRYVVRHRMVGPVALAVTLFDIALVGALNVGMVLLAAERGWGAPGLGWLLAGFSAGAAVGAAILALRGHTPRAGLVCGLGVLPVSVAMCVVGLVPSLPVAVFACAVAGFCGGYTGAVLYALVQTATDPAYLGRVTSVITVGSLGLAPLSYVPVGAAIGLWGVGPVYVACAALSLVGSAVLLTAPGARSAELPRPAAPARNA